VVPVRTTVQLHAGKSSSGEPVYEELLVEKRGPDLYELLASPGLVLGVAAGDTIRLNDARDFEIVTRGGNLCVQVFRSQGVDKIEEFATQAMAHIGGHLDGKTARELVYTVPVSVGFVAVEEALNRIIERFPDTKWYYGNVYDPSDGVTPLNWWK
jgi:hypothetical protein